MKVSEGPERAKEQAQFYACGACTAEAPERRQRGPARGSRDLLRGGVNGLLDEAAIWCDSTVRYMSEHSTIRDCLRSVSV